VSVKVRVNVMAHVSRRALWEPLAERIGADEVYEDDGSRGRWGNGRRCLLNYGPDDSHVLVIQDDALPAADLIPALEMWLPLLPDSILCLYSGRLAAWRQIHRRYAKPPCWLQMQAVQWGVALVVPTSIIPQTVKRGDSMPLIGNYDLRLSEANLRERRLPVLYPSPSWVNHADSPSTVPGRKGGRHALCAVPESDAALDWADPGEAPIIRVPDFQRRPAGRQHYGRA
jgi:hypothetical protein